MTVYMLKIDGFPFSLHTTRELAEDEQLGLELEEGEYAEMAHDDGEEFDYSEYEIVECNLESGTCYLH